MTRVVACAVVRDDPPGVYAADDLETLNWVLAVQLVAATPASQLAPDVRDALRTALLEERWGEAVEVWMRAREIEVDVYPSMSLAEPADVALAPVEIQFLPLFGD